MVETRSNRAGSEEKSGKCTQGGPTGKSGQVQGIIRLVIMQAEDG